MKLWSSLSRFGLSALATVIALKEIARPASDSAGSHSPDGSGDARAQRNPAKLNVVIKTVVITLIAVTILMSAGGLLFMLSGVYPIGADKPHFGVIRWLLQTGRTRSVQFHSKGIHVPNLADGSLVRNGFVLYRKNCQPCHGAPGVAADQIGLGINPKPPELVTTGTHWSDSEIYWITSHGLKLSGMPAFSPRLSDTDRWGIVAFLRRLTRLSPAGYQQLTAANDRGLELTDWGMDDDQGFAMLKTGNPKTGRRLLQQYGCVTCHTIPNIATGHVGPPLTAFAERQYIAGSIVNLPSNTINWIMNPKKYKPKTAMPVLEVKPREAADMAAYLYTLGSPERIDRMRQTRAHVPHQVSMALRQD